MGEWRFGFKVDSREIDGQVVNSDVAIGMGGPDTKDGRWAVLNHIDLKKFGMLAKVWNRGCAVGCLALVGLGCMACWTGTRVVYEHFNR